MGFPEIHVASGWDADMPTLTNFRRAALWPTLKHTPQNFPTRGRAICALSPTARLPRGQSNVIIIYNLSTGLPRRTQRCKPFFGEALRCCSKGDHHFNLSWLCRVRLIVRFEEHDEQTAATDLVGRFVCAARLADQPPETSRSVPAPSARASCGGSHRSLSERRRTTPQRSPSAIRSAPASISSQTASSAAKATRTGSLLR
jgi:hypothetical protein